MMKLFLFIKKLTIENDRWNKIYVNEIRYIRRGKIRIIDSEYESNNCNEDIAENTENSKWIICTEYIPRRI